MNPDNVPPWGCPWHGLVVGGALQLPTGSMPWPQAPSPVRDYQASTSLLLKVPDTPEVTRTTEEAAADDAAGREWRNTAMVGGGTLHGRPLGQNSWIYIDPSSQPWLIHPSFSGGGRPNSVTLTISRFGILGAAPEQHTRTIAIPDLGQPLDEDPQPSAVCLHHVKPDGSGAIFAIYNDSLGGTNQSGWHPWTEPLGFFEIGLSGLGAEIAGQVTTLRTRAQTISVHTTKTALDYTYYRRARDRVSSYDGPPYPVCGGVLTYTDTPIIEQVDDRPEATGLMVGTTSGSVEYNHVVSLYYDEDGLIHEISAQLDINYSETGAAPEIDVIRPRTEENITLPTIDPEPRCYPAGQHAPTVPAQWVITARSTQAGLASLTLLKDGTPALSEEIPYSYESITQYASSPDLLDWPEPVPPNRATRTTTWRWSGGETAGRSTVQMPNSKDIPTARHPGPPVSPGLVDVLSRSVFFSADGDSEEVAVVFCFTQHSATCFGLGSAVLQVGYAKYTYKPEIVTPSGVLPAPIPGEHDSTGWRGALSVYGAWCPITGRASRHTEPAYWV